MNWGDAAWGAIMGTIATMTMVIILTPTPPKPEDVARCFSMCEAREMSYGGVSKGTCECKERPNETK